VNGKEFVGLEEHQLLRVEWIDAYHDYDFNKEDPIKENYMVTTCGFYFKHDNVFLHMAMEILPEDKYRGMTHIPLVLIQDIKKG
jgi:hypothetical protein